MCLSLVYKFCIINLKNVAYYISFAGAFLLKPCQISAYKLLKRIEIFNKGSNE